MFEYKLTQLARAISELLSRDFHHVADRMSQLSDEVHGAFYLSDDYVPDYVPVERAGFIHSIVYDMAGSGVLDKNKQEGWAGVDPEVLFPYVYDYLSDAVGYFAEQYAVAINYLAYHDHANPYDLFGHNVYMACNFLIDWLMDAGDITAAAFCNAAYGWHTRGMINLLGFDVDLFERARALQHSNLNGYTFADIEAELVC